MRFVKRINVSDEETSPRILHISYAAPDANPQIQVSRMLWSAWTYLPPAKAGSQLLLINPESGSMRKAGEVGKFVKDGLSMTDEQLAALPQNQDLTSVHTEWRDGIYQFWNHVFYDIGNELHRQSESLVGLSRFQPPSAEAFELEVPATDTFNSVTKVWDRDVFLVPAYLQSGVNIRLTYADKVASLGSAEPNVGKFENWIRGDIYYVRRRMEVHFVIGGEVTDAENNLAAVMVCGLFCAEDDNDPDDPPGRPPQKALTEEEMEQLELQEEVQSSMRIVYAMASKSI